MTRQAAEALAAAPAVLLRTARHPAAEPLLAAGAVSLDHCYERAGSFTEVYAAVVEEVVAAARLHGELAYAVPGSPALLERSVRALREDERVTVTTVPGMSFADLAWDRLGVDPVSEHVRLVDAEELAVAAAADPGPLLVGHCWSRAVLSEVKLALEEPPRHPVTLLHHLGLPDEQVLHVPWSELDRTIEPDHLTCLYVPSAGGGAAGTLAALVETVRVLRDRCPWDRVQTHQSLVRHLVEECYEVVDAIAERGELPPEDAGLPAETGEHLEEELGDLLVQVLFHARLASEEGLFDLAGVARTSNEKLIGRHPHVFAAEAGSARTPGEVEARWEQLKKAEKGRTSLMEGIPASLPALVLAAKLERKLASVGLGWDRTGLGTAALTSLLEEAAPGDEAALGELLLALARRCAHLGRDPEQALRQAAGELRADFTAAEAAIGAAGGDVATVGETERLAAWRRERARRGGSRDPSGPRPR